MLNEVMDGVTRKVAELFPGSRIYTDGVEQGLVEPCFFVSILEPAEKPMIGRRYFRQMGVIVQYLPGECPEVSRELNRASEILLDGLEYITLEDGRMLRGTGRTVKAEPEKRLLNVQVGYSMFMIKSHEREDEMEQMEANIRKG